jgi:hypothetical protein
MSQRTPDCLVDRVLSLIEGVSATEVHACGMMLISIAISKMRPADREWLLEGLEQRISENVDLFDRHASWIH